jgi:hypothetical protein
MPAAIQCNHIQSWSESINIMPQTEGVGGGSGGGRLVPRHCGVVWRAAPLHVGDVMTQKSTIGHG